MTCILYFSGQIFEDLPREQLQQGLGEASMRNTWHKQRQVRQVDYNCEYHRLGCFPMGP